MCSIPSQLFSCTFKVYWYIHKVYKLMVKCHNLPMMHIRPVQYGESSNKSSVLTIKDARFIFQSIKVKINILAYVSFLEFFQLYEEYRVCVHQCHHVQVTVGLYESLNMQRFGLQKEPSNISNFLTSIIITHSYPLPPRSNPLLIFSF